MLDVIGGQIHYRLYMPHDEQARKNTPLVAIHGGPGGCHACMYDNLNDLANDRPYILYDQLGSYFSPADITNDLLTLDRFVDELDRLINHLKLEKPILHGHSWGGTIATQYAIDHGDKISALITTGALFSTQRWIDDCNMLIDKLPTKTAQTIKNCLANGTTNSKEYYDAENVFCDKHFCRIKPMPESSIRNNARTNRHIYQTMWGVSEFTHTGTLGDVDLFPHLHNITTPALIICGQYDTATPAYMAEVANQIPNAKCEVIPDCGHAAYAENPEAIISSFNQFINENNIDLERNDAPLLKSPSP